VWVSKGLQYPIVYLPFAFNRHVPTRDSVLYHRGDERCLDIGGQGQKAFRQVEARGRQEMAGDDIRLTYVALTRAQSQVVAWWAPSWDEPNGGLAPLVGRRGGGESAAPDRCAPKVDAATVLPHFRTGGAQGGPSVEESTRVEPRPAEVE